jgi:putative transposase
VDRPNQVWCADITYLPMRRGFLYLVAIMDWFTRKVLAWRISNTLEADFCVEALNEAVHKFGPPEIMNTDQGSAVHVLRWTDRCRRIRGSPLSRISMDGKGPVPRQHLRRAALAVTLKYECVYLHAWETGSQARIWHSKSGWSSTITNAHIPPLAANHLPWSTGRQSIKTNPISRSKE